MLAPLVQLIFTAFATAHSRSSTHDVTEACIDVAGGQWNEATTAVAEWLSTEVGSRLARSASWSHGGCSETAASNRVMLAIVGSAPVGANRCGTLPLAQGSFLLDVRDSMITLTAVDSAALRAGAGRLLRELFMPGRGADLAATPAVVSVPRDLCVQYDGSAALWPIRGHQLSVGYHPLQLRTRSAFDVFVRDLSAFGTTTLEAAHLPAGSWLTNGIVEFSSKFEKTAPLLGINPCSVCAIVHVCLAAAIVAAI